MVVVVVPDVCEVRTPLLTQEALEESNDNIKIQKIYTLDEVIPVTRPLPPSFGLIHGLQHLKKL